MTASPTRQPGATPTRILQLTDFHLLAAAGARMYGVDTEQSLLDALTAALADGPPPDLALLTGDLVQDPEAATYARLRRCLDALPCPALWLPGNHDDPRLAAAALTDGDCWSQNHRLLGPWVLICLDSTIPRSPAGRLADSELARLQDLLDRHADRHALIALHHPPIPTGSAWLDTMMLANADRFFRILAPHTRTKSVVCGHIHQELDMQVEGIRVLGTPSTCFQFRPRETDFGLDFVPPGWRWIELGPDGTLTTRVRRLAALPAGLDAQASGYN